MKKIPTLFIREFENHKVKTIIPEITPGCKDAFLYGDATIKFDGSCCAYVDHTLYKRYDAKHGKKPPEGAIPCCEPDPITGHHPHWLKVSEEKSEDKWFIEAARNYGGADRLCEYVTFEAVGKHFNGNPYNMEYDVLVPHGSICVDVQRTFEGIRQYLATHEIEGIVFWYLGEPVCKIKRTDFGFPWPLNKEVNHK